MSPVRSESVEEQDYGITVMLNVLGADAVRLYEPRHPIAYSLG